ncbi:MAG: hypothetical protein E6Q87_06240 [Cellvibrionales bacterium]|nr:MAG: hypothetical protein E6Q87_06240 [Cellvibrionales bacterium]
MSLSTGLFHMKKNIPANFILLILLTGCSEETEVAKSPYFLLCKTEEGLLNARVDEKEQSLILFYPPFNSYCGVNGEPLYNTKINMNHGHRQGFWVAHWEVEGSGTICRVEWNSNLGTISGGVWEDNKKYQEMMDIETLSGNCIEKEFTSNIYIKK